MTIHVLNKQGQSIKSIARTLSLSRNTVRKFLRAAKQYPHGIPRNPRASKLDPYKSYIQAQIKLASPKWIPATALYRQIQLLGYSGKLRIVQEYVSTLKPHVEPEPLHRFETAPGKQMQVDFTTIKHGGVTLKAFVAILGYSRAVYVQFFDDERLVSWINGLRASFEYFGGVTESVLFDNAKAVMDQRDAYGRAKHRWNPQMLLFSKQYGFNLTVCRPYRAKTKGKVERFNRYLKENFIPQLMAKANEQGQPLSVGLANSHIITWLNEEANARVHKTTQTIPHVRLVEELPTLIPLPILVKQTTEPLKLNRIPLPIESMQHKLSIYDELLTSGVSV